VPLPPPVYRERLWPAWWVFVATALVIPASFLVLLPISVPAGVVTAVVLYGAIVVALIATTRTIEVDADELRVGRASLPRVLITRASAALGPEAVAERGVRLDARAYLLLRGWVRDVVRIEFDDPEDPVPYWLVSSRRAEELAGVLGQG